ncbi:3466_t:CDS:2, partial [Racocetra persica]
MFNYNLANKFENETDVPINAPPHPEDVAYSDVALRKLQDGGYGIGHDSKQGSQVGETPGETPEETG